MSSNDIGVPRKMLPPHLGGDNVSQWWATFLPPRVAKALCFLAWAALTTLAKVHIIFIYSNFFPLGPGRLHTCPGRGVLTF